MVMRAQSYTTNVQTILNETHSLHILHCFDQVWNLIDAQGRIVSIVTRTIGNAPSNILIDEERLPRLSANSPIYCNPKQIVVPYYTIDLRSASIWNAGLPMTTGDLLTIVQICEKILQADHHSLFMATASSKLEQITQQHLQDDANMVLSALKADDESALMRGVDCLAGKGIGLTPAGDDWLCGSMLALHQCGLGMVAQVIAERASRFTTPLSANYLRMAGQAKAGESWHELLGAKSPVQIESAVHKILAHGYSSGADTLTGFVQTALVYACQSN